MNFQRVAVLVKGNMKQFELSLFELLSEILVRKTGAPRKFGQVCDGTLKDASGLALKVLVTFKAFL